MTKNEDLNEWHLCLKHRVSEGEATYRGGVMPASAIFRLYSISSTEMSIRLDGDGGIMRKVHDIDFLEPAYAGDFLEVWGRVTKIGETSRRQEFELRKVIERVPRKPSYADVLKEPKVIGRCTLTAIVPKKDQRKTKISQGASAH